MDCQRNGQRGFGKISPPRRTENLLKSSQAAVPVCPVQQLFFSRFPKAEIPPGECSLVCAVAFFFKMQYNRRNKNRRKGGRIHAAENGAGDERNR